jgi:PKHD-type hydroxylase
MLSLRPHLSPHELARLRDRLASADFVDGRETAQGAAVDVKRNEQLPAQGALAVELDAIVRGALMRHDAFTSRALPLHVLPMRFARYRPGQAYGWHIDAPVMTAPDGRVIRTDLACTVFLSDPSSYGGGELAVQTPLGTLKTKLSAGDAVVYPATMLHRVEEVTHGERLVAVTWAQSLVASPESRALLEEMLAAVQSLTARDPQAPELDRLNMVHANMLRRWGQP